MPEDVGGRPFSDGDDHADDHGPADDAFATVVFDEAFVQAAALHEPSAQERLLAAAEARAETEGPRFRGGAADEENGLAPDPYGAERHAGYASGPDELYAEHVEGAEYRPYRRPDHWHRGVAWVLAVVMGIGVVALAFSAVYRGAGGGTRQPSVPPPASGRVGTPSIPPVAVSPSP